MGFVISKTNEQTKQNKNNELLVTLKKQRIF